MKKCSKCKVNVLTDDAICPLCQVPLNGSTGEDIFPYIPTVFKRYTLFFRILLLCCVIISLICIFLDVVIPTEHHFSIYVVIGFVCLLVFLKISLTRRENLPRAILLQVIVIGIAATFWDYFIGWKGWSLTYVVPIACLVGSLDMIILAKIMKLYLDEQLIYFIDIMLLGLVPIIFVVLDIVSFKIPSLICIFMNTMAFFAVLIMRFDTVKEEFKRRFHI